MFPISHYPVITKHDDPQPSVMVHLNRIPRRSISGMLLFGSCPAKCHYPAECIRLGVLLVAIRSMLGHLFLVKSGLVFNVNYKRFKLRCEGWCLTCLTNYIFQIILSCHLKIFSVRRAGRKLSNIINLCDILPFLILRYPRWVISDMSRLSGPVEDCFFLQN